MTKKRETTIQGLLDRPIAYHRIFVDLAGVTGAVMLSQAVYWSRRTKNKDGWFYKTIEEWEDETGLTRREQDTAKKKLQDIGALVIERRGIPARLYFRVNWDFLFVRFAHCTNAPNQIGGKRQTRMAESAKHTITETTTENTHRIQSSEKKKKKPHKDKTNVELKSLLSFFNKTYNRKLSGTTQLRSNYNYWKKKGYSLEDMQQALKFAKEDNFWGSKINPTVLLRRRNPRGEPVDYIGDFLNKAKDAPQEMHGWKIGQYISGNADAEYKLDKNCYAIVQGNRVQQFLTAQEHAMWEKEKYGYDVVPEYDEEGNIIQSESDEPRYNPPTPEEFLKKVEQGEIEEWTWE